MHRSAPLDANILEIDDLSQVSKDIGVVLDDTMQDRRVLYTDQYSWHTAI